MKKTSFVLALLPACLGLLACSVSNTPNPVRYTLTPPAPESTPAAPAVPFARIAVPAYIDTPQIVTRDSENTVSLSEARIWAEPLARAIQRAVPIQVAQNLCGKKLKSVEKVSVFIDRLDGTLDGEVFISAQIVVSRLTETEMLNDSILFSKTIPVVRGEDPYATYARALSDAVAALSQAVADNLCE
jgi:uncharacterized lipoprotein YmbA